MDIVKKLKRQLFLCILAPVCLVVGIPTIVLCAIAHMWILMSLGIAMTIFGFYGTPLLCVAYGKTRSQYTLLQLITHDGILTVTELSSALGKKPVLVQNDITLLISRRYLVGYNFVNRQKLVAIAPASNNTANSTLSTNKCSNCGALLTRESDGYRCRYCGTWFASK